MDLNYEMKVVERHAQFCKEQSRSLEKFDVRLAQKYNLLSNAYADLASYLSMRMEKSILPEEKCPETLPEGK